MGNSNGKAPLNPQAVILANQHWRERKLGRRRQVWLTPTGMVAWQKNEKGAVAKHG